MSFRRFLPTLALFLLLAPGAALAQPSEADKSLARTLANEGYDALDRKDYTTAAERFGRADALVRVPTVALGLARAQVGLGRLVQAEETYRRIVRDGVAPGAPAPLVKAVADARRELDALTPRIPGVIISVTGAGAPQVTLDGAPVSAAALGVKLPVNPGQHVIRASAAGYRAGNVSVMVPEGKSLAVPLELRPDEAHAPARPPAPAASPPAVTAAPPIPPAAPVEDRPASPWPAQKKVGAVLMGVSAVGAVLGGVFAAQAHTKFNDLARQCPSHTGCDPSLASELSGYHAVSAASLASFLAGGALLGTGIVVFVTAPKAQAPAGAFVAPRIGAGYAGVEGGF